LHNDNNGAIVALVITLSKTLIAQSCRITRHGMYMYNIILSV